MRNGPNIPMTHALAWIVSSMLFINGISYVSFKCYFKKKKAYTQKQEEEKVCAIVQTGPQRQALKTEFLAELLGLCADYPQSISSIDIQECEQKLLASPLIAQAQCKIIKPNTLYIDYTVRQPLAYLADFEDIALDQEGYLFPFTPFFSPKNLPYIYLGLSAFGTLEENSEKSPTKPMAQWGHSLKGEHLDIALNILSYVTDLKVSHAFNVTWIDVSQAFATSCGTREIVLITQDTLEKEGIKYLLPRVLRLSTKNYAQELGNYLSLREQLLEEERKSLLSSTLPIFTKKIIDFRIPNLAFIDQ